MTFKEFMVDEGWLSDMFGGKKEPSLGPKMLKHGDKKSPAKSYGGQYRTNAIAKKWNQIQSDGNAARAERDGKIRGY